MSCDLKMKATLRMFGQDDRRAGLLDDVVDLSVPHLLVHEKN